MKIWLKIKNKQNANIIIQDKNENLFNLLIKKRAIDREKQDTIKITFHNLKIV